MLLQATGNSSYGQMMNSQHNQVKETHVMKLNYYAHVYYFNDIQGCFAAKLTATDTDDAINEPAIPATVTVRVIPGQSYCNRTFSHSKYHVVITIINTSTCS